MKIRTVHLSSLKCVDSKKMLILGIGLTTLLYFVLASQGFFQLIPDATYDDGLQFNLAQSLAGGHWLGDYNYLTLAKGVTYPIWIASLHVFDIPLWFGDALLYCAASGAIIFALSRLIKQKWVLLLTYVFVLFNPVISIRVYRDSIAPALILLILAWVVGIFFTIASKQRSSKYKRDLAFFIILGVISLPAWWYLREDALWALPIIIVGTLISAAVIVYKIIKRNTSVQSLITHVLVLSIPFTMLFIVGFCIGMFNQHTYSRFVVNDYVSSDFESAYGALTRIKDDSWQMTVPISQSMREKAYQVSPAFAELRSCLDNDSKGVCENFFKGMHVAITNNDYEGGWFFWALRLAVQNAGYYTNPTKAHDYYVRLAGEINKACDLGELTCTSSERSSLFPAFRKEIIPASVNNTMKSFDYIITLKDADTIRSITPAEYSVALQHEADYLNLKYNSQQLNIFSKIKQHAERAIAMIYQYLNPVLISLATVSLVFMTVRIKKYFKAWPIILLSWGLLLSIVIRCIMLAYVSTISFPAINALYFSSTYPMVFIFETVTIGVTVSLLFTRNKKKI